MKNEQHSVSAAIGSAVRAAGPTPGDSCSRSRVGSGRSTCLTVSVNSWLELGRAGDAIGGREREACNVHSSKVTRCVPQAPATVGGVTGSRTGASSLAAAVQAGLAGAGIPSLTAGTQRLMAAYRWGEVPDTPVMAGKADAAAYAAYRMPATAAATEAAIHEMQLWLEGWAGMEPAGFRGGNGRCHLGSRQRAARPAGAHPP